MRILLAVSGGIDSMYMAHKASEFFPEASFAVAHCNFQLRGAESDGDEEFVRRWAESEGVPCFVRRFDTKGFAEKGGLSIEMAARDLRYGWFEELCREEGYDAVAVAHNANDNAETLMLNMLRGTGSKGMRGMAPMSVRTGGLTVLRPMLERTREEIHSWMVKEGHSWRDDSSNGESVVKRNILRNEVFPVLRRVNPNFIGTLNADMKRFAQVDDIADDYFRSCGIEAGCREIPVDHLLSLKHWQYVLWRLLEPYGFSQQTFEKLTALLAKYKDSQRGTVTMSGKTFESPAHILTTSRKKLTITDQITCCQR